MVDMRRNRLRANNRLKLGLRPIQLGPGGWCGTKFLMDDWLFGGLSGGVGACAGAGAGAEQDWRRWGA